MKISEQYLSDIGFKRKEAFFERINMPYYVKNGFCMFFNPESLDHKYGYYKMGFAESYFNGKYAVVTFDWTNNRERLRTVYEAILNKKLND